MQAYHNLLETRMTDANAVEIKTIAGFINYKLCRIMFSLNLPKDAISQFRLHTERYSYFSVNLQEFSVMINQYLLSDLS